MIDYAGIYMVWFVFVKNRFSIINHESLHINPIMMKIAFTIPLLLTTLFCLAQKPSNFQLGFHTSLLANRDRGHSPLLYNGAGIGLQLGDRVELKNWWQGFELSSSFGLLFPSVEEPARFFNTTAIGTNSKLNFHWLRMIHESEKLKLLIGGRIYGHYNGMFYDLPTNNVFGYELLISINPDILAQYTINEKWAIETQLHFPLVTYSSRPSEQGLLPFEDFEFDLQEVLFGGEVNVVRDVFFVENRLSLLHQLRNKHHIRLFYQWQGGINNFSANLEYAIHQLGFAYWFDTTKTPKPPKQSKKKS